MSDENKEKKGLLVITLKQAETLLVGDDVEVLLKRISSNQIKIAIKAPKELRVSRSWKNRELVEDEILDKKAKKKADWNRKKAKKKVSRNSNLVSSFFVNKVQL